MGGLFVFASHPTADAIIVQVAILHCAGGLMSIRHRVTGGIALILASASPAAFAKSDGTSGGKLEAAYVVLGAQGAIARAVYRNATACPSLTVEKSAQQMNVRALPQTGKKAAFPVLVCELLLPAGTTSAALGKWKLPL